MKSKAIIIGAVVGFATLLLLYFYINREKGPKYNWYQSFDKQSNQPYGTLFIKKMLESSHTGSITINEKEPIHKMLEGKELVDTDYVLLGQSIFLDKQDVEALKGFLSLGNDVFIATLEPPESLLEAVYANDCEGAFT